MLFFYLFCLVLFSRFGFFLFKWTADLANLTLLLLNLCTHYILYLPSTILLSVLLSCAGEDTVICWDEYLPQEMGRCGEWGQMLGWSISTVCQPNQILNCVYQVNVNANTFSWGPEKISKQPGLRCDRWWSEETGRMFRKPALKEIIAMLWFFGLYLPQLEKKWEIHPLYQ